MPWVPCMPHAAQQAAGDVGPGLRLPFKQIYFSGLRTSADALQAGGAAYAPRFSACPMQPSR